MEESATICWLVRCCLVGVEVVFYAQAVLDETLHRCCGGGHGLLVLAIAVRSPLTSQPPASASRSPGRTRSGRFPSPSPAREPSWSHAGVVQAPAQRLAVVISLDFIASATADEATANGEGQ